MKPIDYTLYLCTDRALMTTKTVEESVERAIAGGATVVQLREKTLSARAFYDLALRVKQITAPRGVPLIINDRVDVALAAAADGVHIGQSDLPAREVRRIIGREMLLGVSASTLAEAVSAARDGADYLGVGAMYATATKDDACIVTMDALRQIRQAVSLPIVVIGGINEQTAPHFRDTGVDGLAVVSAIVAKEDIEGAARTLIRRFRG